MAFATTNIRKSVFGNLNVMVGDWSGASGDSSGAITLGGGRVYLQNFENQDGSPDSPKERPLVDVSVAAGIITLTVHNHMNVTSGTFLIIYA